MLMRTLLILSTNLLPAAALAQSAETSTDTAATEEAAAAESATADSEADDPEAQTVLDPTPFPSARAAALAGAIVTAADDMDAAFHNPAGIGGLGWGKGNKAPWIRKVWFPQATLETNEHSKTLFQDARKEGANEDGTVAAALLDANAGDRQYGRVGLTAGLVLGRMIFLPIYDIQVAALSASEADDSVTASYRSLAGGGWGFSAQTPDGDFSLGYFGYAVSRTDLTTELTYEEVILPDERSAALKDGTNKTSGAGHNLGINWRLAKAASPRLGIAMTNTGDARFKAKTAEDEDVLVKQNLDVGFSVTPGLGKAGALMLSLQASRLLEDGVAFNKKMSAGVEWTLWGSGSYAALALRAGVADAGGCGGVALNLGLIGFEAATHAVDIGVGNQRVIERRYVGTAYVNVAEF